MSIINKILGKGTASSNFLFFSVEYSSLKDLEMRDEERVKGGSVQVRLSDPSQLSLCGRDCRLSVRRRYANPEEPHRNSQTHFGLI